MGTVAGAVVGTVAAAVVGHVIGNWIGSHRPTIPMGPIFAVPAQPTEAKPKVDTDVTDVPATPEPPKCGQGSPDSTANGYDRWLPTTPNEKIAEMEVKANPEGGKKLPFAMKDPRWPAADGWQKMQRTLPTDVRSEGLSSDGITVHYNYNPATGDVQDVKITQRTLKKPPQDPPRSARGDDPDKDPCR